MMLVCSSSLLPQGSTLLWKVKSLDRESVSHAWTAKTVLDLIDGACWTSISGARIVATSSDKDRIIQRCPLRKTLSLERVGSRLSGMLRCDKIQAYKLRLSIPTTTRE